jgi:hypothetical protein
MVTGALVVAGLLVWVALTLILDACSNHRAERLIDRPRPCETRSLADEAQRWLENQ